MKADQIILGKIITLDTDQPQVEAMVVKDGRIAYLGKRAMAVRMKGENTKVLDYGAAVVYPGFMDAHTHGPMAGQRIAFECNLVPGRSMPEYVDLVRRFIEEHPGRNCYRGAGWEKHEEPTRQMLDAVAPDVPVVLTSADGHSMWLNTAALKACGYTAETVKKLGEAQVHVDADGNPNGVVCEMGTAAARSQFPITKEDMKEGLLAWQSFAFSQGITAVGEALLDMYPTAPEAYAELIAEGKWKLRTYAFPSFMKQVLVEPQRAGELLRQMAEQYDNEYLKIVGLKIVLDGVVEAHTGYLLESYSDQPDYHGVCNQPDVTKLTEAVKSANSAGFSVHTHTIGDGAVKLMLDAIEAAEMESSNFDARNMLAHLQLLRPEDVQRCGDLNVGAIVAPLWMPINRLYFDQMVEYLGEDRAWSVYPLKSFVDAGVTMCFHTDYPVSPEMNLPKTVYCAVRRESPDLGVKSAFVTDEAISSLRALLAMTANVAYLFRQEHHLGTLAVGKVANASVYDRDFIHYDDVHDIAKAKLVATIVDGDEVYRA